MASLPLDYSAIGLLLVVINCYKEIGMFGRLFSAIPNSFSPNIDSESLKRKIKSSVSPVIEHDFGLTLGSIFFIRPDANVDMDDLMHQIHAQPEAQKVKANMAWIVGGPILSSRGGKEAMRHHKLFVDCLSRPDDYIKFTLESLADFDILSKKKLTLRQLTTAPVYNLLSKGLLGHDRLPAGIATAFEKFSDIVSGKPTAENANSDKPVTDVITDFAKNNFNILRAMYYPSLLGLMPVFSDARSSYVDGAKAFIQSERDTIKNQILLYSVNKKINHIIALSVIEIIKENNPIFYEDREALNDYLYNMVNDESDAVLNEVLENDYIHTVPGNIFAAINLRGLIPCIIHALTTQPNLLDALREDFKRHDLSGDLSDIKKYIMEDKKATGLFHRLYLEGLRMREFNEPLEELQYGYLSRYYISNSITVNDTVIPGGSVICILNGMMFFGADTFGQKPESFNPNRFFDKDGLERDESMMRLPSRAFSRAPRVCPAYLVTEYITKAFIAYLVTNYDWTWHAAPNESSITKVFLEFAARAAQSNVCKH